MHASTGRTNNPVLEFVLGLGFLAVIAAVVAARSSPATGYEVSIYSGTPLLVWVLLAGALLVATATIVARTNGYVTTIATLLGGVGMTTTVAIPILRGYNYMGPSDSLTHLGWTKDIASGTTAPHSLFYPGFHSLSLAVARFMGVSLELALLVTTVVFLVAFLVFIPLTVGLITGDTRAMGFAAVGSWLVLPINNVATHLIPHTNSLALFYLPVLLFSLVLFLRSSMETDGFIWDVRSTGVVLAILGVGIVLIHPQHAVNVLLLFLGVCGAQFLTQRSYYDCGVTNHRPLYRQTALLGLFIVTWVLMHDIVVREVSLTVGNLFRDDIGTTATVAQRGGSLAAAGGSLGELFVKMFLVSAIIGALTAGYLALVHSGRLEVDRDIRGILFYFGVAFVPLTVLFCVYFLGKPKMSFRQLGFIYVLVTIIGAMAITRLSDWAGRRVPEGQTAVGVVLAICLLLSMLTVFGSPYIYIATPGVPQQEMQGYDTALETRTEGVPLVTLSSQPSRYGDAKYGTARSTTYDYLGAGDGKLDPEGVNSGRPERAYPNSEFHVALSKRDVVKEIDVYEEINYRESQLDSFDTSRQSNRVLSNGEFELYYVSENENG